MIVSPMRPLGAHMSVAGGILNSIGHAAKVASDALQIFSKSQLRWQAAPIDRATADAFKAAYAGSGLRFLCIHVGYLINLASPDADTRGKSLAALGDEVRRAAALGCGVVVMHPGSPKEDGREAGMARIAAGLERVLADTADCPVAIALENTAGQGATIGDSLEELGDLASRLDQHRERIAFCFDTCHGFAAGIDLRSAQAVGRLADDIERFFGLERLVAFHLNDSKTALGSRRDRHEQIGKGHIGEAGFANLLAEPRFKGIPGIIETDKDEKTLAEDVVNLNLLRRLEGAGV